MDAFWEIIASNAVVATILAIGAALLGAIWKNAAAIHVLWIVVLVKLFTPPLVTTELPSAVRVLASGAGADSREKTLDWPPHNEADQAVPVATTNTHGPIAAGNPQRATWTRFTEPAGRIPWSFSAVLAAIWICGACSAAVGYAVRIHRFARVIRNSEEAPPAIRAMVARLSSRLGLRRTPDVFMTSRALPPLVWSIGLFPRVILPSELFARLSSEAQGTILAHELCHIRRGDYLVRLLELAATTVFWWHPVVWWAGRQLRELEEQCCDSRVLELEPQQPRTYAAALVDTLEFLSERPRTPVPLRTTIYSTGSLARRIRMLTQSRTNRLSALSATLVAGLVTLPLVVAFAVEQEPTSKSAPQGEQSAKAPAAILRGRVTNEGGDPLADVLVRAAIPAADMRFVDPSTPHKQLETRSDASGDYRLVLPGIIERTTISIDAMKPGYRRLVGTLMSGGDRTNVEVVPGAAAEASLKLKPALYFAGIVVDEQGKPIPAVKIAANSVFGGGSGGVERTASNPDGSFELFNYSVIPGRRVRDNEVSRGAVSFSHKDYLDVQIEDVYALIQEQREALRIVLGTGYKVTGKVVDVAGKPVPNVMIKAIRDDGTHRKATMTDAQGKFALRGLGEGPTTFSARALNIKQRIHLPLALDSDQKDLEVRLQPMSLPADLKRHAVLGMQLADVTPEIQSTYDLYHESGALILDPGTNPDRLKIGRLAEGYYFWLVGKTRIGSVREFVNQILTETTGRDADLYSVRVVYGLSTLEFDGTNTQYLKLTKDDIKQLQVVLHQLKAESR